MKCFLKLPNPVAAAAMAACLLVVPCSVLAQTDGTKSLEGSTKTGGKVMTREELRTCLKRQDELAKTRNGLEPRRAGLTQERDAIQAENESIRVAQVSVKERNAKVGEHNERLNAFAARVDAYNKGMEELSEMRAGPFADRRRRELDKEKAELKRIDDAQKADGAIIQSGVGDSVAALNARIDAQAKRAVDWNARSKALDDAAAAYEDERIEWKLSCGDRRYREDDEKAIRAGN